MIALSEIFFLDLVGLVKSLNADENLIQTPLCKRGLIKYYFLHFFKRIRFKDLFEKLVHSKCYFLHSSLRGSVNAIENLIHSKTFM